MIDVNLPQREDIWFLVTLSTRCVEKAQLIKQENINNIERTEALVVILNDAIVKLSKLQHTSAEGVDQGLYYYQNLIDKL